MKHILLAAAAATLAVGLGPAVSPPAGAAATATSEAALRAAFTNPDATSVEIGADVRLTDCAAGALIRESSTPLTIQGHGHVIEQACLGHGLLRATGDDGGPASLVLESVTLTGAQRTAVWTDGEVTTRSATFRDNSALARGGAIFARGRIVVEDSMFLANRAGAFDGGAIFGLGDIEITRSTFADNHARLGGAVFSDGGPVEVTGSTFTRNSADTGGAVRVQGGSLELFTSTVTGNRAEMAGGGVSAHGGVFLGSATVVENSAPVGANVAITDAGPLWVNRAVVAAPAGGGENCSGAGSRSPGGQGYGYSDDNSCLLTGPTDTQDGPDPRLGDLADNGGPTQTLLPALDSPLVDAAPAADCADLTDQRGISRPQGSGCDIGAVEREAVPPAEPPRLSIADLTVREGDDGRAPASLRVRLDSATTETVSVDFATVEGTATASHDFVATRGTLVLRPGELVGDVVVEVTGDTAVEGDESFTVELSNPQHAGLADGTGVATIVDDDPGDPVNRAPVVEDVAVTAPEARTTPLGLAASDPDPGHAAALTWRITDQPEHGSVTGSAPELVYASHVGYEGADALEVQACDPAGACDTATVSLDVTPFQPPDRPPADADQLVIDRSVAKPGESVTVSGADLRPGETAFLVLHSAPVRVGAVTVDEDGEFTASVRIPDGTSVGDHRLVAYGTDSALAVPLTITERTLPETTVAVPSGSEPVATQGTTTPGPLPATGGPDRRLVVVGGLLVACGAALLLARRRRA